MPLNDYIPLMKFIGQLVAPVLYIVCFASKDWVTTPTTQWGLWEWCYTNFSDRDDPEDHVNDTNKCHSISPGDSPGYYEAVRTIGTFALVSYILFFFAFNEKEGLGKEDKPSWIAFVACLLAVTTLGILGDNYKDDERWKDQDPSLGWCFWLVTSTAILSSLLVWVFWKYNQLKNGSSSSPRVSQAQPQQQNTNNSSVSSSNNSSSSSSNSKASNIRSSTADGAGSSSSQRSPEQPSASSARSPSSVNWRSGDVGEDGRFPVLTLPRYDIPSEPSGPLPNVPPPSYEEVTRGGVLSPPPPYTVTESADHRAG